MYPNVIASDVPEVEFTTDREGRHLVVFSDRDTAARVAVHADALLCVAFKMCNQEIDTEWAKRHLKAQGYEIKPKKK